MTSVPQFNRRFSLQQQFDDINARHVRCPVQTGYSVGHCVHLQTTLQQKLVSSAILTSPRKASLAHELAHVAQYERLGGFYGFLKQYLEECINPGYPLGALEQEAKQAESSLG